MRNLRLSELLLEFGDTSCTDIRDRVFGLLSLASDCKDGQGLQPNYWMTKWDLFWAVLHLDRKSLDSLSYKLTVAERLQIDLANDPIDSNHLRAAGCEAVYSVQVTHLGVLEYPELKGNPDGQCDLQGYLAVHYSFSWEYGPWRPHIVLVCNSDGILHKPMAVPPTEVAFGSDFESTQLETNHLILLPCGNNTQNVSEFNFGERWDDFQMVSGQVVLAIAMISSMSDTIRRNAAFDRDRDLDRQTLYRALDRVTALWEVRQ